MNFIFTLNEKYILQKTSIFTTKCKNSVQLQER